MTTKRDYLRACEALAGHIAALLIDIEAHARDGGLTAVQRKARDVSAVAADFLADIRSQLEQNGGQS